MPFPSTVVAIDPPVIQRALGPLATDTPEEGEGEKEEVIVEVPVKPPVTAQLFPRGQ